MDTRLATPLRVLQVALGLTATLAGLDKFFNILRSGRDCPRQAAARVMGIAITAR